jgi:pimeloyl-ACP methyl ester carboxylesterase
MKFNFLLLFVVVPTILTAQIEGVWHTSFTVLGMSKQLDLNIEVNQKALSAKFWEPDAKSPRKITLDTIYIQNDTLRFNWESGRLNFVGKHYEQGDSICGMFEQGGIRWNSNFTRTIQVKKVIHRPQEPKPPFQYSIEEIKCANGDVTLAGTLTLPKNSDDNYPIVVLASGSGPQNRDCEILGHKSFWVIADFLAKNGVGCLRFDDRGIGESTGSYSKATLVDFGNDLNSCVNKLLFDSRFKNHPIGVVGHSEGGMHALIAANKNKQIAFVIELASVGTSGEDVLIQQQYLIPKKSGASEELALWNKEIYEGCCAILRKFKGDKRTKKLDNFLNDKYEAGPTEYKENSNLLSFKLAIQLLLNNDWGSEFIQFKTKDFLKKVDVPILVINGSEDIQVPAQQSQEGFRNNFSDASKPQSKLILMKGLNHLFQTCQRCTVDEYGEIEETFSENALQEMLLWMTSICGELNKK